MTSLVKQSRKSAGNANNMRLQHAAETDEAKMRTHQFAADIANLANHGYRLTQRSELVTLVPSQAERMASFPGAWAMITARSQSIPATSSTCSRFEQPRRSRHPAADLADAVPQLSASL